MDEESQKVKGKNIFSLFKTVEICSLGALNNKT